MICSSSLLLLGCSFSSPAPAPVFCHAWTKAEKEQHYKDDVALPHENSLHGIIKDYERVCAALH
jgi:hypothetical protein